jgi:hypothetical protein
LPEPDNKANSGIESPQSIVSGSPLRQRQRYGKLQ